MPVQLPVQFSNPDRHHFSSFFPAENEEILAHLQQIFDSGELFIFLWGESGSGKTHLLHATCELAKKVEKTAFYYDLDRHSLPDPVFINGLETVDLVCFDNIEAIAGIPEWEQAFFNLYNQLRELDKQLILSASTPPKFIPVQLPDLKSRINWGLTLRLKPLTDEQLIEALIYKANDLGFEIPENVGRFLFNNCQRKPAFIWPLLDKIEQKTLIEKRKLSIPFLKQILMTGESE